MVKNNKTLFNAPSLVYSFSIIFFLTPCQQSENAFSLSRSGTRGLIAAPIYPACIPREPNVQHLSGTNTNNNMLCFILYNHCQPDFLQYYDKSNRKHDITNIMSV